MLNLTDCEILGQLISLGCEEGTDYTSFVCHEMLGPLRGRDRDDNLEHGPRGLG